jgi:hypothetical protein
MQQRQELAADVDRAWARPAVLVPVFALIALVAGALPSFSLAANLLVLCVGGTLFWLGVSHHVPRRQSPRRLARQTLWWMVPLGLLAVVESVNFLMGSTESHPTLSKLADPILEGYVVRAATYFGWLTAFWGLVRR